MDKISKVLDTKRRVKKLTSKSSHSRKTSDEQGHIIISLRGLLLIVQHIWNEARLRGINMVSENVNNFADGAPFIHLANVENIEAEGLHE